MILKKYTLCFSLYPGLMDEKINQLIAEGYDLHGDPFHTKNGTSDYTCQAMVLYEEEPDG